MPSTTDIRNATRKQEVNFTLHSKVTLHNSIETHDSESENETFTSSEDSFSAMIRKFLRGILLGTGNPAGNETTFSRPTQQKQIHASPSYRRLTPIDLTQPFLFDDAEEIAGENTTVSEVEELVNTDLLTKEVHHYQTRKANKEDREIGTGLPRTRTSRSDRTFTMITTATAPYVPTRTPFLSPIFGELLKGLSQLGEALAKPIEVYDIYLTII
jgi:hypothetical protein